MVWKVNAFYSKKHASHDLTSADSVLAFVSGWCRHDLIGQIAYLLSSFYSTLFTNTSHRQNQHCVFLANQNVHVLQVCLQRSNDNSSFFQQPEESLAKIIQRLVGPFDACNLLIITTVVVNISNE